MKIDIHWTNKSKGVYIIKNNLTQQIYVGSSRNSLYSRLHDTIRLLRRGDHHNDRLQNSFNKYGEDMFSYKYKALEDKDNYILRFEERVISLFKPFFNICLHPTFGGKPNLNRKLPEEWRINLHKNKNYKHSSETMEIINYNNKMNSCNLEFIKNEEVLNFHSWVEAGKYFEATPTSIQISHIRFGKWKGYIINRLTKQKKNVKLYYENEVLEFSSASECDKFLDMWKGATSFYLLRDGKIKNYKIEYIKTNEQ